MACALPQGSFQPLSAEELANLDRATSAIDAERKFLLREV